MAKRGRPRKYPIPETEATTVVQDQVGSGANTDTSSNDARSRTPAIVAGSRGRRLERVADSGKPADLPHPNPKSFPEIWANALKLASTISDHYSMRPNEQSLILQYALLLDSGATLVELGVTHGRTAAILCYAAKLNGFDYVGIDNFSVEGSASETKANLNQLNLPFKLLVGETRTVSWDSPIDFLIIDAGHDVVNVAQDSERFLPFVRPGGLVVYHDYNPNIDQSDPHWGIKNAVERFCSNWETINQIEWLIIKRKPLT